MWRCDDAAARARVSGRADPALFPNDRAGEPVDLSFVLLVPEEATDEHLELLRQIAGIFEQEDVRERLRNAADNNALYQTVLNAQL